MLLVLLAQNASQLQTCIISPHSPKPPPSRFGNCCSQTLQEIQAKGNCQKQLQKGLARNWPCSNDNDTKKTKPPPSDSNCHRTVRRRLLAEPGALHGISQVVGIPCGKRQTRRHLRQESSRGPMSTKCNAHSRDTNVANKTWFEPLWVQSFNAIKHPKKKDPAH